jgi:hypothetical protein
MAIFFLEIYEYINVGNMKHTSQLDLYKIYTYNSIF